MAGHPRVVAIGEIGLDYHYDHSPREAQRALFAAQLDQLEALGLPVVIHSREAADDTFAILASWLAGRAAERTAPGLLHCFGYDAGWAERFLELGFLLSIPGVVTYPKAEQIKQVAAMVPHDRFTVETDCPYLAPQSHRGRRNEPAYLPETVRGVAALRGCSVELVAAQSVANTRALFKLPGPVSALGLAKGAL